MKTVISERCQIMVRKKPARSCWKDVFGVLGKQGRSDKIVEELRGKPDAVDR